jgi:hypothetical protein
MPARQVMALGPYQLAFTHTGEGQSHDVSVTLAFTLGSDDREVSLILEAFSR